MTKNIPLSLACGDYESIRPLKEGSVTVDGVDLTVLTDMDSASRHWRMIRGGEFDIAELSMSSYLMAADRDNPKVNHLCQPLSPPVLRVLNSVIQSCLRADRPVTLCGEMAGAPSAFVLLLGMGLRNFSMSPAFVPSIKDLASHLSVDRAERILHRALQMKTVAHIKRFVHNEVADIAPSLALLDTA